MTKLDLIKLIIDTDAKVFEELEYTEWNVDFFQKLLLLADKISYVGETDKIGYIEIDNECVYVEPKTGYEFTSFGTDERDSCLGETAHFSYYWKIKKEN